MGLETDLDPGQKSNQMGLSNELASELDGEEGPIHSPNVDQHSCLSPWAVLVGIVTGTLINNTCHCLLTTAHTIVLKPLDCDPVVCHRKSPMELYGCQVWLLTTRK